MPAMASYGQLINQSSSTWSANILSALQVDTERWTVVEILWNVGGF